MTTNALAFETLTEVARHSLRNASGLPAQIEVRKYWSGVAFEVLGVRMVAALDQVIETLEMPSLTRLPGVHPWVLGVANVRGRLLPITDLSLMLSGRATKARRGKVLIVEKGELFAGLLVDAVHGIKHFPEEEFVSGDVTGTELDYFVQGSYPLDGQKWSMCSIDDLVSSSKFMHAAMHAI